MLNPVLPVQSWTLLSGLYNFPGYGENYVHGLGHGIGLEIHEMPNINKRGQNVILQPGMTFTVEPGIYIPGKGGVRIEDTVVLTDEGAKVLTGVKNS